jgi:hypothetical protein
VSDRFTRAVAAGEVEMPTSILIAGRRPLGRLASGTSKYSYTAIKKP